jgi:hypothetical protein
MRTRNDKAIVRLQAEEIIGMAAKDHLLVPLHSTSIVSRDHHPIPQELYK